jgi:transposase-like protein
MKLLGQRRQDRLLDGGVSTRRVAELVQAMGLSSISKSQVSELCNASTSG